MVEALTGVMMVVDMLAVAKELDDKEKRLKTMMQQYASIDRMPQKIAVHRAWQERSNLQGEFIEDLQYVDSRDAKMGTPEWVAEMLGKGGENLLATGSDGKVMQLSDAEKAFRFKEKKKTEKLFQIAQLALTCDGGDLRNIASKYFKILSDNTEACLEDDAEKLKYRLEEIMFEEGCNPLWKKIIPLLLKLIVKDTDVSRPVGPVVLAQVHTQQPEVAWSAASSSSTGAAATVVVSAEVTSANVQALTHALESALQTGWVDINRR